MQACALLMIKFTECCALDLLCSVHIVPPLLAGMSADQEAASLQALQATSQQGSDKASLCQWQKRADGDGLELVHQHSVSHVTWHARGDYFATVAPAGNTQVSHLCYLQARHMHALILNGPETLWWFECAENVLSLHNPELLAYIGKSANCVFFTPPTTCDVAPEAQ